MPHTDCRSEQGAYKTIGKVMAAILGNPAAKYYLMWIYVTQDNLITQVNITDAFRLTVCVNKYCKFHRL